MGFKSYLCLFIHSFIFETGSHSAAMTGFYIVQKSLELILYLCLLSAGIIGISKQFMYL